MILWSSILSGSHSIRSQTILRIITRAFKMLNSTHSRTTVQELVALPQDVSEYLKWQVKENFEADVCKSLNSSNRSQRKLQSEHKVEKCLATALLSHRRLLGIYAGDEVLNVVLILDNWNSDRHWNHCRLSSTVHTSNLQGEQKVESHLGDTADDWRSRTDP